MKRSKVVAFLSLVSLMTCILFPIGVSASELKKSKDLPIIVSGAEAKLIDSVTGEVTQLEVKELKETAAYRSNKINDVNETITKTYEVVVDIPGLISPQSTNSGSSSGDIKAKLSVDYALTTAQLKLTKVYGTWTPSNEFVSVSQRSVFYRDGIYGHNATKKPTSNSFSYTTGWGYVDREGSADNIGARAVSDCYVTVPGMPGGYTVSLTVLVP